jgi:Lipocalin-like domain
MAVNIMRTGRATWASPNPGAGAAAETADAASGYIAYAGSFTVDEAASVVEHHVGVSLYPNWIGVTQKRLVDLQGDDLVLEAPPLTDAAGNSATPRLRWRRIA